MLQMLRIKDLSAVFHTGHSGRLRASPKALVVCPVIISEVSQQVVRLVLFPVAGFMEAVSPVEAEVSTVAVDN